MTISRYAGRNTNMEEIEEKEKISIKFVVVIVMLVVASSFYGLAMSDKNLHKKTNSMIAESKKDSRSDESVLTRFQPSIKLNNHRTKTTSTTVSKTAATSTTVHGVSTTISMVKVVPVLVTSTTIPQTTTSIISIPTTTIIVVPTTTTTIVPTTTVLAPITVPLPTDWKLTSPCHGTYPGQCLVREITGPDGLQHPVIYDPVPYPGWPNPPVQ